MYRVEILSKNVPINELIEGYRDEAKFLSYCRECPNYGRLHSCPPLRFDPLDYLREYSYAELIAVKITYDDETIEKLTEKAQQNEMLFSSRKCVQEKLERAKLDCEREGVISVAASACSICEKCSRRDGRDCIHPDKMRYTFDSFGFDVTAVLRDYFDIELIWAGSRLQKYQCSLSMLLNRQEDFSFDPSAAGIN